MFKLSASLNIYLVSLLTWLGLLRHHPLPFFYPSQPNNTAIWLNQLIVSLSHTFWTVSFSYHTLSLLIIILSFCCSFCHGRCTLIQPTKMYLSSWKEIRLAIMYMTNSVILPNYNKTLTSIVGRFLKEDMHIVCWQTSKSPWFWRTKTQFTSKVHVNLSTVRKETSFLNDINLNLQNNQLNAFTNMNTLFLLF